MYKKNYFKSVLRGTDFLLFMVSVVLVKLHSVQNWHLLYLIVMYIRVLQYSYKIQLNVVITTSVSVTPWL
jgi:hypothetical protein